MGTVSGKVDPALISGLSSGHHWAAGRERRSSSGGVVQNCTVLYSLTSTARSSTCCTRTEVSEKVVYCACWCCVKVLSWVGSFERDPHPSRHSPFISVPAIDQTITHSPCLRSPRESKERGTWWCNERTKAVGVRFRPRRQKRLDAALSVRLSGGHSWTEH